MPSFTLLSAEERKSGTGGSFVRVSGHIELRIRGGHRRRRRRWTPGIGSHGQVGLRELLLRKKTRTIRADSIMLLDVNRCSMMSYGGRYQILLVSTEKCRDAPRAVFGIKLSKTQDEQVQRRRHDSESEENEGNGEDKVAPTRVKWSTAALNIGQWNEITEP